jgi:hypothetical protein
MHFQTTFSPKLEFEEVCTSTVKMQRRNVGCVYRFVLQEVVNCQYFSGFSSFIILDL